MNTVNLKMVKYDRIEDPGHSWLEVPIKDVIKSGIYELITAYSPKVNKNIYLEEDCDMGTFLNAMKNKGYNVGMNRILVDDFDTYLETV